MSPIVPTEPQSGPPEGLDDRCRSLREEWTTAEYQRLRRAYSATAGGVDAVSGSTGPLFHAQVEVEDVPVDSLVDTGSSATIMSFELFQQVGKQAKLPPERLQPPTAILRDYSRNPIPIGAQAELTLTWRGRAITTTVYIRSDPRTVGEPCLLGTNVVMPLALMAPAPGVVPRGDDNSQTEPTDTGSSREVRLVQSQRIPPRSSVVVQAQVDRHQSLSKELIVESNQQFQRDTGMVLEDSLVRVEEGGLVQLVVSNPSNVTKHLLSHAALGAAENGSMDTGRMDTTQPLLHTSETSGVEADVSHVQEMPTSPLVKARKDLLGETINIMNAELHEEGKEAIRACILGAEMTSLPWGIPNEERWK